MEGPVQAGKRLSLGGELVRLGLSLASWCTLLAWKMFVPQGSVPELYCQLGN